MEFSDILKLVSESYPVIGRALSRKLGNISELGEFKNTLELNRSILIAQIEDKLAEQKYSKTSRIISLVGMILSPLISALTCSFINLPFVAVLSIYLALASLPTMGALINERVLPKMYVERKIDYLIKEADWQILKAKYDGEEVAEKHLSEIDLYEVWITTDIELISRLDYPGAMLDVNTLITHLIRYRRLREESPYSAAAELRNENSEFLTSLTKIEDRIYKEYVLNPPIFTDGEKAIQETLTAMLKKNQGINVEENRHHL